jgi:hypothetical protein
MSSIAGWFVVFLLTGVIGLIGWWQWKSYVTLNQPNHAGQKDDHEPPSNGTHQRPLRLSNARQEMSAYAAAISFTFSDL